MPHDARDRYDHHPIRGAADPQRETRPEEHRKDLGNLDELAVSLRVNGMQQPIIVNATGPNTYRLVDGARRHAAALRAGLPSIPALIAAPKSRGGTVSTMLAAARHKQLHPIEQARAFAELQDDGMTVAEMCRSPGYIRTFLEVAIAEDTGPHPEVHLLIRSNDGESAQGWFRLPTGEFLVDLH